MSAVRYRIEIEDAHAHLFRVTLTLTHPAALQAFSLPVWIPGSYLVREFSRHLSGLQARQGGRELALRQTRKNAWAVACNGRGALTLSYSVYAFDDSVRTAFLDAERAFFNASSLCLCAQGQEQSPHQIEFGTLPRGWQIATAMPAEGRRRYVAADYEELIDHPFELGRFWRGEFIAGGVPHELVVSGALPVFDEQRLLKDTQQLCEAQIAFWHGAPGRGQRQREAPPFARYVFLLNAVGEGYGGLEHRASTALLASRADLPVLGQGEASEGYVRLLGLVSHEYFHAWNVKRLRPAEFASFDLNQENYTELLWFFEGFTSYYDEFFLRRCGLVDATRYLKLLASTASGVLAAPGRKQHSLVQASFEAWIKYYRPDENTPNATVSYYTKGALVALALDLSLRSGTPASSLDALMRALWRHSGGGPIDEEAIFETVAKLGGAALAEQLRRWVHGTDDLPLPALCERFGLQWGSEKPSMAHRLGLRVGEQDGVLRVKQVLLGGAAHRAGVAAGDEILAANDWRLRKLDELALTLDLKRPQRVALLVSRDQRLHRLVLSLPLQPAAAPVRLALADKAAPRALSLRRAWLGV